jgi:hypothetical protein
MMGADIRDPAEHAITAAAAALDRSRHALADKQCVAARASADSHAAAVRAAKLRDKMASLKRPAVR